VTSALGKFHVRCVIHYGAYTFLRFMHAWTANTMRLNIYVWPVRRLEREVGIGLGVDGTNCGSVTFVE
jgi:hypothetical protein